MTTAIVIAVEGVLFDTGHRRHLIPQFPWKARVDADADRQEKWDAYWKATVLDRPIPGLCMIVDDLLAQGRTVVFVSSCPSVHDLVLTGLLRQHLNNYEKAEAEGRVVLMSRAEDANYADATDAMLHEMRSLQLNVLFALLKNKGMIHDLRRAYPAAIVLNAASAFNSHKMINRRLVEDNKLLSLSD